MSVRTARTDAVKHKDSGASPDVTDCVRVWSIRRGKQEFAIANYDRRDRASLIGRRYRKRGHRQRSRTRRGWRRGMCCSTSSDGECTDKCKAANSRAGTAKPCVVTSEWKHRCDAPLPADVLLSRIVALAVTLTRWSMKVDALLLSSLEIQRALGPDVQLADSSKPAQVQALSDVLGATAIETAFHSVSGRVHSENGDIALAVATLALVFDTEKRASATFNSVGQVAHLRTKVGASMVAVETVTSSSGLVSYWGYVHHAEVMVIVTLDTLDPQRISMTEFRAVVTLTVDRLEQQVGSR